MQSGVAPGSFGAKASLSIEDYVNGHINALNSEFQIGIRPWRGSSVSGEVEERIGSQLKALFWNARSTQPADICAKFRPISERVARQGPSSSQSMDTDVRTSGQHLPARNRHKEIDRQELIKELVSFLRDLARTATQSRKGCSSKRQLTRIQSTSSCPGTSFESEESFVVPDVADISIQFRGQKRLVDEYVKRGNPFNDKRFKSGYPSTDHEAQVSKENLMGAQQKPRSSLRNPFSSRTMQARIDDACGSNDSYCHPSLASSASTFSRTNESSFFVESRTMFMANTSFSSEALTEYDPSRLPEEQEKLQTRRISLERRTRRSLERPVLQNRDSSTESFATARLARTNLKTSPLFKETRRLHVPEAFRLHYGEEMDNVFMDLSKVEQTKGTSPKKVDKTKSRISSSKISTTKRDLWATLEEPPIEDFPSEPEPQNQAAPEKIATKIYMSTTEASSLQIEPEVAEWDEFQGDDVDPTDITDLRSMRQELLMTPQRLRVFAPEQPAPPMPKLPEVLREPSPNAQDGIPASSSQLSTAQTRQRRLKERLKNIFPVVPLWLQLADFAVIWEVTRIALHCQVDLSRTYMDVSKFVDQDAMYVILRKNPLFTDKKFPAPSDKLAFETARISGQTRGQVNMYVATLNWSEKTNGPLLVLTMSGLKIERGSRLHRRFGADRFLEINFPYPRNSKTHSLIKDCPEGPEIYTDWITRNRHSFLDREWAAFYTRDSKTTFRNKNIDPNWGGANLSNIVSSSRVIFFAEGGRGFKERGKFGGGKFPTKEAAKQPNDRVYMSRDTLLDWAIEPWHDKNKNQPTLKLFSRIALSLSSTFATITLPPSNIYHEPQDILSPTSAVMNDGIGTMSKALAVKISETLGLPLIPCGFQGRIGSAKGFWIIHPHEPDKLWIRTYPSQRKWICSGMDPDHRTFEVHSEVRGLKQAGLNTQFIPIIMEQAKDREKMLKTISAHLRTTIEEDMLVHKTMVSDNPAVYLQWVYENPISKLERIARGEVQFLGGLPRNDYEAIAYLIHGGFHPLKQKFLFGLIQKMVKVTYERLQEKMKIKIPKSTYAYMVVDFLGVLEEGEVHIGFSQGFHISQFETEQLLHGQDALVARSPAHFPSDIQRVKLVFRPELRHLNDVIVFSIKGNRPLADLLSGGDYDGDQAWLCWDQDIVQNFHNAAPPYNLELSLKKDKTTFKELGLKVKPFTKDGAITDFINYAFNFNMYESLLGICTVYKETLCYHHDTVSQPKILMLSALLGQLVDQTKQGYTFTREDWIAFQKQHNLKMNLKEPQYKGTHFYENRLKNSLDILKFEVALPAINQALKTFNQREKDTQFYDQDLTVLMKTLDKWCEPSVLSSPQTRARTQAVDTQQAAWKMLRKKLNDDLGDLINYYISVSGNDVVPYDQVLSNTHTRFLDIRPHPDALAAHSAMAHILQCDDPDNISLWGRLKASKLFMAQRATYSQKKLPFLIAGRQLQRIKAEAEVARTGGEVVSVVGAMYAVVRPDKKVIAGLTAQDEAAGYADTVVASQEDLFDEGMRDSQLLKLLG